MHERFRAYANTLDSQFQKLIAMPPVTACSIPKDAPASVIYLFSEGSDYRYVGRTKKLRQRMRNHCGPSSQCNQASFAVLLAREETRIEVPAYSKTGGLKALATDAAFVREFEQQKARIRGMDLRYVQEDDPVRQALLEIYVSIVLQTPYNDFGTH